MVSPQRQVDGDLAQVMEQMPYGCYIVGSRDAAGELNGMMADWLMQVSFVPRMVAVSFENDAHTLANIRETHTFTVNMLPQDEAGRALAAHFLQPYDGAKIGGRSHRGDATVHHKLDGLRYSRASSGCPILEGVCAWLECEAAELITTGDHTLVTARVLGGSKVTEADVLTSAYAGWAYSG